MTPNGNLEEAYYHKKNSCNFKLKKAFNNIPLPTVCLDNDFCLLKVNSDFLSLVGYTIEELAGFHFTDLILSTDFDKAKNLLDTLFYKNVRLDWDCRLLTKGRSEVWVNLKSVLDEDSSDEPTAYMVVTDISKQREIEEKSIESRKIVEKANRSKNEFLANLSHEIRTPLSVISGYAQLILEDDLPLDISKQYLRKIEKNAWHLTQLVGDVLDLSKIESGKIEVHNEECNIQALLEDTLEPLKDAAGKKGLGFSVTYAGELPNKILTDPTKVKQIVTNLVGNAIKFTETGKVQVTVTTKPDQNKENYSSLGILVHDTGIGLDLQQREKLFKLFSQADSSITRRFGGTGLGLRISRALAQKLGGNVTLVTSQPKRGSTFRASVRVKNIDKLPDTAVTNNSLDKKTRKNSIEFTKVLLVDDSLDLQFTIAKYLSKVGKASVDSALNGEEALRLADKNSYDIILMDMQMPQMGGLEATQRLRQHGCEVPIIALSANALSEEVEKGLQAGCNDYLTKPIHLRKLLDSVRDQLNSSANRGVFR